jgi:hypothetical protein
MMGYYESQLVPVICHITQLIKQGIVKKTMRELAFDLTALLNLNEIKHNSFDEDGTYVEELGRSA